jgi:hypothetical protein
VERGIEIGAPVNVGRDESLPNTSGDASSEVRSIPIRKSPAGARVAIGVPEPSKMKTVTTAAARRPRQTILRPPSQAYVLLTTSKFLSSVISSAYTWVCIPVLFVPRPAARICYGRRGRGSGHVEVTAATARTTNFAVLAETPRWNGGSRRCKTSFVLSQRWYLK